MTISLFLVTTELGVTACHTSHEGLTQNRTQDLSFHGKYIPLDDKPTTFSLQSIGGLFVCFFWMAVFAALLVCVVSPSFVDYGIFWNEVSFWRWQCLSLVESLLHQPEVPNLWGFFVFLCNIFILCELFASGPGNHVGFLFQWCTSGTSPAFYRKLIDPGLGTTQQWRGTGTNSSIVGIACYMCLGA